eukprot:TRINITY_DN2327_c0_g2_i4.p1 TRINITY_DN2327_c0_g2~~TRINITY_DN2327_c0_g2_i4.p1  ORF type:complete len:286 (+),score=56.09 TRINITY_DN2327_c0_g2_i4:37-894(+)
MKKMNRWSQHNILFLLLLLFLLLPFLLLPIPFLTPIPTPSPFSVGIWREWPQLFKRPEVILDTQLKKNKFHPFSKVYKDTYFYKSRNPQFGYSLITFVISTVISILFVAFELYEEFYFLLPLFAMVVSALSVYEYRLPREYWLHGGEKKVPIFAATVHFIFLPAHLCPKPLPLPLLLQYEFKIGNKVITKGEYFNVYIRLRKKTAGGGGKFYYYLIFNGFQMEKLVLSKSSEDAKGLRLLGQQLANDLNINYFDDPNISKHHVVKHFRPVQRKIRQMRSESDDED